MSLGGCFVETREPAPFGTELTLRFNVPGSSTAFVVFAVVRWTTAGGMGVQFRALRAQEVYVLTAFLANKPLVVSIPPAAPDGPRTGAGSATDTAAGVHPRSPLSTAAAARAARAKPPLSRGPVEGGGELAQAKRELEQLRADFGQRDAQLAELRAGLAQRDAELAQLQTELEQRDARLAEVQAELGQRDAERAELRAELEQRDAKLTEVQAELEGRDAALAELRAELTETEERAASVGDDLTRIRGIGPAFDRALRSLGVNRYAQIAAWSEADIEEIARKLKSSSRRIRREGWVESAAALSGTKASS